VEHQEPEHVEARAGSPFEARLSVSGGGVTVWLSGEFDSAASGAFTPVMSAAEAHSPRTLVLDLRSLTFLDSYGLRQVLEAQQRADQAGVRLVLVRGPQSVHRVFELTATDRRLEMVDSPPALDEALEGQR
jgi:anti-sigma B factor antagonist